ncbi:unnamed protein product [Gongylonema pulchrum]|uniref:Transmembrane protein n=1 Tax=Gongylonema pulchrum TaxID=637853 RepID=A0A183EAS4_9BILA|nr:unnamed protein product [Gongylonema pulchrum]
MNKIDFGRRIVKFDVPDHTVELVEDELDSFKNLLMKPGFFFSLLQVIWCFFLKVDVAVTDSLNPESRGGFYFKNGFELLLPLRAVAKDATELPKIGNVVNINTTHRFLRKTESIDTTTDEGKSIYDGYFLSDAARRFLVRRELHRANSRRFIIVPAFAWLLMSSAVVLTFVVLLRYGRLLSYSSVLFTTPMAIVSFRDAMRRFVSYGEMMLDHDTCAESPNYVEGALQYLKSSAATNVRLRKILGDSKSEYIAANGDRIGDAWPYSKRLKSIQKFAAEEFQKQK